METLYLRMRKRWTPKTEITESLLLFREKRKWQIALRRYILEKNKSSRYAPYFGLDSSNLRKWIEIHFDDELNWNNFSTAWQFDHRLPITYFDFSDDADLRLCWNFLNIKVQKNNPSENKEVSTGILSIKNHFQAIYQETANPVSLLLVQKIQEIETKPDPNYQHQIKFIVEHQIVIEQLSQCDSSEFDQINSGISIAEIQAQKELVRNFGDSA
jgi:hypothetical protein